jgi:HD-GYP domain-containing protein (c-di-GMP phosphodiesterase class II)
MAECSSLHKSFVELVEHRSGQEIVEQYNLAMDFEKMKSHLISVYNGCVGRWFQAMDIYDRDITGHTLRVTAISLELGRLIGLKKEQLVYIQYGTLLHDIGKLGIPDAIIQKPGKLTAEEYQVVKRHPLYAYEWLSKRNDFQPAKVIPLFHHERWDGTGYPNKLKGNEIPLLARVVAIVDVWDAITSDRPYWRAMSNDEAIRLIMSESGKHFDPDIVKAFLKLGVTESRTVPYCHALI